VPLAQPDDAFAAVVRSVREEQGITREALAFRAGITNGALARIELAQSCPSWDTVKRIASALGVPIGELAAMAEAR
jgi:transcriptional regulator with XRE-family HTH domain